MGKNPAFQFYPSDWTRDLDDQDLEIEGAWIRILCRLWWSEKRGEATKPLKEWARILRKTEQKTIKIFQILIEKGIASGSLLDNQNITIISRRMMKDVRINQIRHDVGLLGGNPGLLKIKNNRENLVNQTSNQNNQSSSSSSSSIKRYSPTSDEVRLSELLFQKIKKRNPGFKDPNIQKWAVHIERLIRIDKRTSLEIEKVIEWSQDDLFWQNNILSTDKLRKQYDALNTKRLSGGDGNGSGAYRRPGASYTKTGRGRDDGQGGLGIPAEYKPEPRPVVSEEGRAKILEQIKEFTGG